MKSLFAAAIIAYLISLLLTRLVRDLAIRHRWLDRPGGRHVHKVPTPRLGGVAVWLSVLLSLVILRGWEDLSGHSAQISVFTLWRIALPGTLLFAVGLWDDLREIRPLYKLGAQAAAGGLLWLLGVRVRVLTWEQPHQAVVLPGQGSPNLAEPISLAVTVFWVLLCVNALNLVDGIDGLAGGVGAIACGTLALTAYTSGNVLLTSLMLVMVGALLGFLKFNFNPASIFLGDGGSLFTGFVLAASGVLWSQKQAAFLALSVPMLVLTVPMLEVALTVARRSLGRKPLFTADAQHVHHRLLQQGATPKRAALSLYVLASGAGAMAYAIAHGSRVLLVVAPAGVVAVLLWIRSLRYPELTELVYVLSHALPRRELLDVFIRLHRATLQAAAAPDLPHLWGALGEIGTLLKANDTNTWITMRATLRIGESHMERHWGSPSERAPRYVLGEEYLDNSWTVELWCSRRSALARRGARLMQVNFRNLARGLAQIGTPVEDATGRASAAGQVS